ncbi:hypothetical protein ACLOJK_039988 [Asimina triloba]
MLISSRSSTFPQISKTGHSFSMDFELGFFRPAVAMSELISASMSTRSCGDPKSEACRNEAAALPLKLGAIGVILIAGVLGVAVPLVGKKRRFLTTDGNLFVVAKAFAAGVILATGFVHMLPDGAEALTDRCLPRWPWAKFPFAEFVAMLASLGTLFVEFVGTQFYERKHADDQRREREEADAREPSRERVQSVESGIVPAANWNEGSKVFGDEGAGREGMHIVGMHAHAAAHRHSHPQGRHSCEGHFRKPGHVGHAHVATWGAAEDEEGPSSHVRHVVLSQNVYGWFWKVLELGIVSHSVIIGLSLGVSQSPCTIRPLIGALAFHQFFEGFALGGCISQTFIFQWW